MWRFLLLFWFLVEICAENSTEVAGDSNESEKNKINGETYLFQVRRDNKNNDEEPVYKRVNQHKENVFDFDPQAYVKENSPEKNVFGSLKNRRRNYLRLERFRNAYSAHLLDDEWKFNVNNQDQEVPEIINHLYKSMEENVNGSDNISSVRFMFEDYTIEDHENEDTILKFNIEALENKTDEFIIEAELHIYRFTEANESFTKENKHPTDEVIRLHQLLQLNDTEENASVNPDFHKLLNVIYVSSQYSGWQVFKVRNIIQSWLNGEANLGFLLTATDSWENPLSLNIGHKYHGKYQPMLIVYLSKYQSRGRSIPHLTKPNMKQLQDYFVRGMGNKLPTNPTGCNRQIWYVSFQELGWNNFIIEPSGFMAFQCRGSCFSPMISSTTNHALLKYLFHSFVYVKKPCCVPDTYKPLTIMFFDANQNVVIKVYEDMIVDSCACR